MNRKIRVFIAGDSTAATKLWEKHPETGWGQVIGQFFTEDIEFINHSVNGRSSKSFIDEGRLQIIADSIGSGDFLFIQFGHNDEKEDEDRHTDPFTSYKSYLSEYIQAARKAGAYPVLLTPVQRRTFNELGEVVNSHGEYPNAMRELADELNITIIDISEKSKKYFESIGSEKAKEIFLWLEPGQSSNYPEGIKDNTHFCENGAKEIAKLVIEGIAEKDLESITAKVTGKILGMNKTYLSLNRN